MVQENKKSHAKPTCDKEIINKEYSDQPVSVGNNLPSGTRQVLIRLLKEYIHVFTWTPTYMVGVDRKVIEHRLMIKPRMKETNRRKGCKEVTEIGQSMLRSPS